uniref:Golgi apparatus membrane protein TVP23 homolog n=1 Tax=Ascaris lumbricoides TaxID=6252 RepID=A0A0M3I3I3_ASCLU
MKGRHQKSGKRRYRMVLNFVDNQAEFAFEGYWCRSVLITTWRGIRMATSFDSSLSFGAERSQLVGPTGLAMFTHPSIVLSHVAFRAAAIFFYVFAYFFTDSFIIQFLVILTFLSVDFWTVKNITGRLLVGLRWWNFVDAEGNNHWRFESARDSSRFDPLERRVFWGALVVGPLMWAIFVSIAFLTLKWEWMIVAAMGLIMNGANLYGYLRCKWNSTQELTNYISKWAFISVR